jgi:small-conductance mechanosensitive channel
MDITGIITAVGTSGAMTGFFAWLGSRVLNRTVAKINESQAEINFAQADNTSADYADKIINQADKRVAQHEADTERIREDMKMTNQYAKEQREDANKWRNRCDDLITELHELSITLKDAELELAEAKWNRCINNCPDRRPPRRAVKKEKTAV